MWTFTPKTLRIALYEPQIPQNTGNIARTCVATATALHLIGKPGFSLEDRYLKRAGLDYWEHLEMKMHENWKEFTESEKPDRVILFTSHDAQSLFEVKFRKGDILLFGNETSGVPEKIHNDPSVLRVTIPQSEQVRCLNLSNSAAIGIYEAIRQIYS
ncbi:MAG: tRNA (uridine(34)/cytosine(34)/5-carboxymethylaminomethyluridine(34)-2'-O)-methyltransferase TrmL [Candidatus Wallbacteria bacterium HGW-Wallbacteria-1]|jgi:tRNA (cytidine/uridine-2'-O-)-methyltransferase|uniref:Putative tRNA (cytidine(34)-2'-O)-methyltransferase n=1 Tax=Candidatus Wallbacteria bacterium HGW-Wallbacteria-1 TaxID=2013854 RepID=A0A2N1PR44_9BACT|nr:MAG: tRNA (uridine(34)/cytosine(34)/5-carboxymethylaminomethyluridine(34)-2'-O)-methyltransferase TrmL [Candidatus Wallbacteria bacterium HGW-Wallbacteria-1]